MPEEAILSFASQELMQGLFGPMRLRVTRESVDLSRVGARSGLPYLIDHDSTRPLGRVVRTEIRDGIVFAEATIPSVSRSEPYLEELRSHLRDGVSPGMFLHEVEFIEENGEIIEYVKRWMCYELSSVTVPRMQTIGLISLQDAGDKASLKPGPTPTKATSISTRPVATVKTAVPAQRPAARVKAEPTQTPEQRRIRMTTIESRVDEKLVDLSRRERALTDVEAKPATGAPLALDRTILSLAALASNPSAPTPPMPGVEVQTATRNHVSARVPFATAALTGATTPTTTTTERGDVQATGRRAERILRLFRPASPPYGSQRFPIMDTGATAGMVVDGGPALTIVDGTFRNPAPEATPHMAQVRAKFTMGLMIQGGDSFRLMVDDSLRIAMQELMLTQVLTGDGVSPSLTGITNVTGILSSEYTLTNRGSATSFRDAENVLEDSVYGPEIRPAFLIGTSLYRTARETLREPGTGEFVLEDSRVLGETIAYKSGDLPDDQALLLDAGHTVLAMWDAVDLIVDGITDPGNIKITMSTWLDLVVLRAASIVLMDLM